MGRTVLLGDSAHGMGPALGQGAAQAFTDAAVLEAALTSATTVERALASYQRRRSASVWNLWVSSYVTLKMRRTGLFTSLVRAIPGPVAQASFSRSARTSRPVRRSRAISG
jgi:2-polyprenyl-6-methoxyphenol hydroxylase-like FAD-dependent oxidoreductase